MGILKTCQDFYGKVQTKVALKRPSMTDFYILRTLEINIDVIYNRDVISEVNCVLRRRRFENIARFPNFRRYIRSKFKRSAQKAPLGFMGTMRKIIDALIFYHWAGADVYHSQCVRLNIRFIAKYLELKKSGNFELHSPENFCSLDTVL